MHSNFIPDGDLVEFVAAMEPFHGSTSWLFVTIDSNTDLARVVSYFTPRFTAQDVIFSHTPGGLWLAGSELTKPVIIDELLVPFSICYIFEGAFRKEVVAPFKTSIECNVEMGPSQIAEVAAEMARIGAVGFASDGIALHYLIADAKIASVVDHAFSDKYGG